MSQLVPQGIDRNGLDASFEADETLKSNLIVEGQLLSAEDQADAAADRFAQAAAIEERLSARCAAQVFPKRVGYIGSAPPVAGRGRGIFTRRSAWARRCWPRPACRCGCGSACRNSRRPCDSGGGSGGPAWC